MTPDESRAMAALINSKRFTALGINVQLAIRDDLLDKKIQTFEQLEERIKESEDNQ